MPLPNSLRAGSPLGSGDARGLGAGEEKGKSPTVKLRSTEPNGGPARRLLAQLFRMKLPPFTTLKAGRARRENCLEWHSFKSSHLLLGPFYSDCGNPTFTTRGKIVGGRRAERGAHPWQVSLWNTVKKQHFCGGSLVSDRWIVTAAHCVNEMVVGDMVVRLGKFNLEVAESFATDIKPKQIKIHPSYDSRTYDSDLALIQLKKRVTFTDYIKPICLPLTNSDSSLVQPGNDGIISGWGARKEGKKSVRKLHEVKIPIVDELTCKRSHPKYPITTNMFCAGAGTGSTSGDACQGDSGGPFSIDSPPPSRPSDRRHVQLGVVSWGEGCGRVGKYGVYTRLTRAFVDWIKKEMTL